MDETMVVNMILSEATSENTYMTLRGAMVKVANVTKNEVKNVDAMLTNISMSIVAVPV